MNRKKLLPGGGNILRMSACAFLFLILMACGKEETKVREEFLTPKSTYLFWIKTGVEGDLAGSIKSMTEASKRMMDQMSKERAEFMRRMTAGSAVFKNYSIIEEKISGDRALVLLESPDKKARIPIPLALEGREWKIDLVKMFGG